MTKPELLKWLDGKCADALRKVNEQEQSAKSALLQQKIEQSKFDDFAAYVIPRMQEIYDRLNAWHSENENLVGPVYYYSSLSSALRNIVSGRDSAVECLRKFEIRETQLDKDLEKRFARLYSQVEGTYRTVRMNLKNLANAKLGMEYLEGLGFDLSEMLSGQDKPVETALAVPVNTALLLLDAVGRKDE
jgi:hypothetical protein